MTRCVLMVALLAPVLSANVPQQAFEGREGVEEIFGMRVGPEGIAFQVFSGGCTTKENFKLEKFGSDPVQLLLIRVVTDPCEAHLPYGTRIRYSYESLGLEDGRRFIVLNPRAPITVRTDGSAASARQSTEIRH